VEEASLRRNLADGDFGDRGGIVIDRNCRLAHEMMAVSLEWTNSGKEVQSVIAYVTVGADDIAHAKRFYSAFLPALGYGLEEGPEGLSYALPMEWSAPLRLDTITRRF
jgi:hypothetical protein